jgi:hypothetical protein
VLMRIGRTLLQRDQTLNQGTANFLLKLRMDSIRLIFVKDVFRLKGMIRSMGQESLLLSMSKNSTLKTEEQLSQLITVLQKK